MAEDTITPAADFEAESESTAVLEAPPPTETDAQANQSAQPAPAEPATPDAGGFVWGTGRRKTAVCRVRVRPGEGGFRINGRQVDQYFSEPQHRQACVDPLEATNTRGKLEIFVTARGGGYTGQAEATLLGVARALIAYDPSLEPPLRERGYLTRDPREVERKKYGQPGARSKFQFSKR